MWGKKDKKERIFIRARGRCEYCGLPLSYEAATLDHWQPRARCGSDADSNLRLACKVCNRAKADLSPNAFLSWLDRIDRFHKQRTKTMKPTITRDVIVLGIESNGSTEHPAKITRVWADSDTKDSAVLVNLTVFPDGAAPFPQGSVLLFDNRDQAMQHRGGNERVLAAFWPERV